jgi:hypothetical protein
MAPKVERDAVSRPGLDVVAAEGNGPGGGQLPNGEVERIPRNFLDQHGVPGRLRLRMAVGLHDRSSVVVLRVAMGRRFVPCVAALLRRSVAA